MQGGAVLIYCISDIHGDYEGYIKLFSDEEDDTAFEENLKNTGKKLKYGTDFYMPEYDNAKNAKKAFSEPQSESYKLTITGKKNFTRQDTDADGFSDIGTKTVSFRITGTAMSKVAITGVEKSYPFTGTVIKPIASLSYKTDKEVKFFV